MHMHGWLSSELSQAISVSHDALARGIADRDFLRFSFIVVKRLRSTTTHNPEPGIRFSDLVAALVLIYGQRQIPLRMCLAALGFVRDKQRPSRLHGHIMRHR